MAAGQKLIAVDLDNTLCEELPGGERCLAKAFPEVVSLIRHAHNMGHRIVIYTARPWTDYRMTKKWLWDNGVSHESLVCGKLNYSVLLDDRALSNPEQLRKYLDNADK